MKVNLIAIVEYHEEMRALPLVEYRKRRQSQSALERQREDRRKRRKPKQQSYPCFAWVEQSVIPTLLAQSDDAIRVYATAALFVDRYTGDTAITERRLFHELFFAPYHTSFASRRIKAHLAKKQRQTRARQLAMFQSKVRSAIEELVAAGLVKFQYDAGLKRNLITLTYLHSNGQHRNIQNLNKRNSYFTIPSKFIHAGSFAMYRGHLGRTYKQLAGRPLRIFLLALRDHDVLRFGGIDINKVHLEDGTITCVPDGWPLELTQSITECESAFATLISFKLFKTVEVIASRIDGHLIRAGSVEAGADEISMTIFAYNDLKEF